MIGHIILVVVVAAVIAGLVYMVRFLMRTNIMCEYCGYDDCKVWDRVPPELQSKILTYFRSHEHREPDTKAIIICDDCMTVFDDFSGKRDNPDVNVLAGALVSETWCKVCGSMVQACEPDNDNIHCRTCGTRHDWRTHEASGYRFLMPPKDASIRQRCGDLSGEA